MHRFYLCVKSTYMAIAAWLVLKNQTHVQLLLCMGFCLRERKKMKDAYLKSRQEVLEALAVDPGHGLTEQQIAENGEKYGANSFTPNERKTVWSRVWDGAKEPMIVLLWLAALITLGVNLVRYFNGGTAEFIECVGIFIAIFLSIMIAVVMEGRSAKAFEALNRMKDNHQVRVLRKGEMMLIPQKAILVGDILPVETGDKIWADGRLTESISLLVDESSLTGESTPVEKDAEKVIRDEGTPVAERVNLLYSGSYVAAGAGRMIVTSVGDHTEFGLIARELATEEDDFTPLQQKLAKLGKTIAMLGAIIAAVIFILQLIALLTQGGFTFTAVSDALITSIVLIVAAVPEGLPTVIALALAFNMIQMSKQNALVKRMSACETIGSVDMICSDKTGTLTENRMTLREIYADGVSFPPEELKGGPLLDNFCFNSTADISANDGGFLGNPTECALLVAVGKCGCDYRHVREETRIAKVFPFSSETKNMTTLAKEGTMYCAYTKGSPEKIISLCDSFPENSIKIAERIGVYQAQAGRVLAFAHRQIPDSGAENWEREAVEQNMVFDGFVVIADPLRKEVYEAVEQCRRGSIDLKILTGDHRITAQAIGRELGVLSGEDRVVEARELESLSDDELAVALREIKVIARSTPTIKMRVVKTLKTMGHVVAVTGDGVNDAPAIKHADIGIAMGISGTEVSQEASDIVLLDDSFSTIVKAVKWGRGIYENLQKFIQFQLTVNLSSVIVVLTSVLLGMGAPFTALQLLWINLIMDGPPGVALGLDQMKSGLLDRKPVPRDKNIVTWQMMGRIVFIGLIVAVLSLVQTAYPLLGGTPEQQQTIVFTFFVLCQLFNAFNCRELSDESIFRSVGKNRRLLMVFAATFLLQVVITQNGGAVFQTTPLPLLLWLKIIALSSSVIVAMEAMKLTKWVCLRLKHRVPKG